MLRCLPPLVLISGMIALAQVHEVYYQGDLAPLNIAPTFNRGFNRSSGAWQPAPFTAPGGSLLGADGNNLVFELSDHVALRWVPVPEAITSQTRR